MLLGHRSALMCPMAMTVLQVHRIVSTKGLWRIENLIWYSDFGDKLLIVHSRLLKSHILYPLSNHSYIKWVWSDCRVKSWFLEYACLLASKTISFMEKNTYCHSSFSLMIFWITNKISSVLSWRAPLLDDFRDRLEHYTLNAPAGPAQAISSWLNWNWMHKLVWFPVGRIALPYHSN